LKKYTTGIQVIHKVQKTNALPEYAKLQSSRKGRLQYCENLTRLVTYYMKIHLINYLTWPLILTSYSSELRCSGS